MVKVSAQRNLESFHFTKEWLEAVERSQHRWLTGIESSNQSPLISLISRIAWLPGQGCSMDRMQRMLNPLFPRFSLSFWIPLFFSTSSSNRAPYLSAGTESSSKLHANRTIGTDFNGSQPAIRPQIPLEMLIPIIRPTIVSGTGLNGVEGTPIPLICYISRRKFKE